MSIEVPVVTCCLEPVEEASREDAVVEDVDNELLEDGLSAENAGTPESVELSPCPCGSSVGIETSPCAGDASADSDFGLSSVFSVSPSPLPASSGASVKTPTSVTCSLCLRCFKCLAKELNIQCLCNGTLVCCGVCCGLRKPCLSIPQRFNQEYDKCLEVACQGASMELKKHVKELSDKVDKFHSVTSKLKAKHNLLELCHLHYLQLQLQFLTLNELCKAHGKPALPELEMELSFTDMFV